MKQSLSTTSARLHQLPAALLFLCAVTPTLGSSTFVEDLGNFPDATEIGAQFGTFNTTINGNPINATGFLFDLTNTSFGDGLHSSFENEPDGDFAQNDVLAATAAAAIKVFDGVPGLDIKTEMAWEQGSAVQTEFSFGDNPELRPRGELLAPVPVEVWLFASGVRGQCRLETQEGLTLSALCSTDSGPL